MHRRTKQLFAAIALIAVLAAGGAAFTASNTLPPTDSAGYGNVTVTGADVSDIHNVLSSDGTYIDEVDLTFSSAIPSNASVNVGFSTTANGSTPNPTTDVTCTVNAQYTGAACTPTSPATHLIATDQANESAVVVSH